MPNFPAAWPAADHPPDGFAQWLTARSFSMLVPMCRLGLVTVLGMLLVVDPVLLTLGVWPPDALHRTLVAWHACAALHFLGFQHAALRAAGQHAQMRLLGAFFIGNALLVLLVRPAVMAVERGLLHLRHLPAVHGLRLRLSGRSRAPWSTSPARCCWWPWCWCLTGEAPSRPAAQPSTCWPCMRWPCCSTGS